MKYYKLLSKDETHRGNKFKTGLNVDDQAFDPHGDCESGGIYFAREDILGFLYMHDYWIREVTLPEDARVYKNPGKPVKWKADKVILSKRKRVTVTVIKNLLKAGADVHADSDDALHWASYNGHTEIVKMLKDHGGVKCLKLR